MPVALRSCCQSRAVRNLRHRDGRLSGYSFQGISRGGAPLLPGTGFGLGGIRALLYLVERVRRLLARRGKAYTRL